MQKSLCGALEVHIEMHRTEYRKRLKHNKIGGLIASSLKTCYRAGGVAEYFSSMRSPGVHPQYCKIKIDKNLNCKDTIVKSTWGTGIRINMQINGIESKDQKKALTL